MASKPDCSVDGCDRPQKGRGYCRAHLDRLNRTGSPGPAVIRVYGVDGCKVAECDGEHVARGYCGTHLARLSRHGSVEDRPRIGDRAPNWRGDAIGYQAAHKRVEALHGRASSHACPCGNPAVDWAYDGNDPDERTAEVNGFTCRYSTDPAHYRALCRPCHRALDGADD